jgi:hypothetical protein
MFDNAVTKGALLQSATSLRNTPSGRRYSRALVAVIAKVT